MGGRIVQLKEPRTMFKRVQVYYKKRGTDIVGRFFAVIELIVPKYAYLRMGDLNGLDGRFRADEVEFVKVHVDTRVFVGWECPRPKVECKLSELTQLVSIKSYYYPLFRYPTETGKRKRVITFSMHPCRAETTGIHLLKTKREAEKYKFMGFSL